MDANLRILIEKFLIHRRKSNGSWAKVTPEDMDDLYNIIDMLIEAKFETDSDGDLPIEYVLINRNTHHGLHYVPEPYSADLLELRGSKAIDAKLNLHNAVTLNFSIASDAMNRYTYGVGNDLFSVKKQADAKKRKRQEAKDERTEKRL